MPPLCTSPMLATPGPMPTSLDAYGYEVKWDGYRALCRWDGARFLLCSRNGIDLSDRFPELAPLRRALRRPVLLDGEIVALDRHGRPSFSALQTRMPAQRAVRTGRTWDPVRFSIQYMIFDVLHADGASMCPLPYTDRRRLLESLPLSGPAWQVPPWHADGPALLALMARTGQEGIIAKLLISRYHPGRRTGEWIKVKLDQQDEFIVVGYWSSGRQGLSSLLLGCFVSVADAKAERNLRFCGKVGTGFSQQDRLDLLEGLSRFRVEHSPVIGDIPRGAGITWCKPVVVVQIRYSEWTHDGSLRHPAFIGLRSDKRPRDVIHPMKNR